MGKPNTCEKTAHLCIKDWNYATSSNGSFVEYTVIVQEESSQNCTDPHVFAVQKRFGQFGTLHTSLRELGFALPDMPTGDLWTNVMIKLTPKSVLRQRRMHLQKILNCISNSKQMQGTQAFRDFISTNAAPMNYFSLRDVQLGPQNQMIRQETN